MALVGFPDKYEGEKWGKRKEWILMPDEQREILTYDFIEMSPGQARSLILHFGTKIM